MSGTVPVVPVVRSLSYRPTTMRVDTSAITENVRALKICASTNLFCAVVKADGYGHGSVAVARAAIAGGANWLAVALVEEAIVLREAGFDVPILVLSEPPAGSLDVVLQHGLTPTVYSMEVIAALADAAQRAQRVCDVHLKVDTGMHRVGAQPDEFVALARAIVDSPLLRLGGVCTHLATADSIDSTYTDHQLMVFDEAVAALRNAGIDPGIVHAANSAGAIAHPLARYDMVRCGIAIYGQDPDSSLDAAAYGVSLRPAVRLVSAVSHVKTLDAGERISYGLTYELNRRSIVATVPIGYADGVPRRLSAVGGELLIGGHRWPIAGRVTMDQIMVDCGPVDGPGASIARGDEVVLLGTQGEQCVATWDWATRLDTIAYEITCAISARVPRVYIGGS